MARSLPEKVNRAILAGFFGFAQSSLALVVLVTLGTIALQAGVQWYARGSLDILPTATAASAGAPDVPVLNATPTERKAIREAVTSLRYRLPEDSVTFGLIDRPPCAQCLGYYQPATGIIQLERAVVTEGGALLQRAVAHEIGHFVDIRYMTEAARARYRRIRDIDDDASWAGSDLPWPARPAEDFAEVFATFAVPAVIIPPDTEYGGIRDPRAIRALFADVDIRLDGSTSGGGVRGVVAQQLSFLRYALTDTPNRILLQGLVIIYLASGTISRMIEAWRR